MVTPETTDSAELHSTKLSSTDSAESHSAMLSSADSIELRSAKLSSAELFPTKQFPTMDLIPATRKATMDIASATLPFQALKSLCDSFFPDRYFNSIQEAVEITMKELTLEDQSKL